MTHIAPNRINGLDYCSGWNCGCPNATLEGPVCWPVAYRSALELSEARATALRLHFLGQAAIYWSQPSVIASLRRQWTALELGDLPSELKERSDV